MRLAFWSAWKRPAAAEPADPVAPISDDRPVSPAPKPSVAGDLDIRAIGNALARRRMWILVPTAVAFVLSLVAVNLVTPRYKSEARILVEGRENVFTRANAERPEERSGPDPEAVTSQVQLVLSRDLAREVIKKNKLAERPEFDPVLRGVSPAQTLLALFGFIRDPLQMSQEERVLEAYYDRLAAFAVEKSRVIAVEFQSWDPDLAARVANSIAEGYLAFQQAAKQEQARSAGQWLLGEIDNLRTKVADAESRVEDFRSKSSLFIGTNNTSLSNQQMGEVNTQLNNARSLKADAESKARLIRQMLQSGKPIEAADVLNSELIRRLSEQRVTLRGQLAEQSSTLLANHPRIKELKAQIGDLDGQIREEAGKIARSLDNDARIAGARVEGQSASLEQMKKQATSSNSQDVQLRALEREAKAQRDLLESYLTKYREASARENIDAAPADARVISRAFVSNVAAYPKKLPIVLIATLATLLLSSGVVITGELLRMTAAAAMLMGPVAETRAGPVFEQTPAPIVQQFAPVQPMPEQLVVPQPMTLQPTWQDAPVAPSMPADAIHPTSEPAPPPAPAAASDGAADLAHLAQMFRAQGSNSRKITVIGTSPLSGTAQTALALARLLSRDARVVLVDLSMPDAAAQAQFEVGAGVSDLVRGAASFGDIITRDRLSNLQIVSAGRSAADRQMLLSPRLSMAIDALMQVYDHVVLDGGVVPASLEALLTKDAHAVLMADSDLDPATRQAIADQLTGAGFRAATVLNPVAGPDGQRASSVAA